MIKTGIELRKALRQKKEITAKSIREVSEIIRTGISLKKSKKLIVSSISISFVIKNIEITHFSDVVTYFFNEAALCYI
jgi:hypothetical protein